jgi:hypothetical protein
MWFSEYECILKLIMEEGNEMRSGVISKAFGKNHIRLVRDGFFQRYRNRHYLNTSIENRLFRKSSMH